MAEGGGDSPVLSVLQERSCDLYRVAVAVAGAVDYTGSLMGEVNVLRRLREQVKQQKFDLQNRISAGEISIDELEYITEENLKEAIGQLVLEIENVKVSNYNKSMLLQRMQVFYTLQNKLVEKNADSEVLRKTMNHSLANSSLILKEQKETRAMEKKLNEIREKRMALKEKSAELTSEILSIVDERRFQKEPKEKNLKNLFKYIKKETDITFMLQNIFQRLVQASRVDWVADPKLKEAVIKAGKDLNSF